MYRAILDPSRVAAYDEAKLFAHAAAETQVAIKEEFLLAPSSGPSSSTYPFLNTLGFLEVYPRVPSKPPKLFQELESLLADKLRECEKAAAVTAAQARGRDPNTAANLTMPVYKQVFDAFIMAFQAYAPLLSEIKVRCRSAATQACSNWQLPRIWGGGGQGAQGVGTRAVVYLLQNAALLKLSARMEPCCVLRTPRREFCA